MVVKISKHNRLVLSEDIFKQCTKFSISRIASMKSHRYSPSLLFPPGQRPLFSSLLYSCSSPMSAQRAFSAPGSELFLFNLYLTVHIEPSSRTGLSPRRSPRVVCKRHTTTGALPTQPGSRRVLTTCFLGSARPSVENCATSTYSVQIWSIFKDVLNVKWANRLQCPAWNVDNHYFHLVKFFLSEITSYGICNFVFEVSGKISHSFIDIFAKRIIIEG